MTQNTGNFIQFSLQITKNELIFKKIEKKLARLLLGDLDFN